MDNATAAAVLYGNTSPQGSSSNAQGPERGASVASLLYGAETAKPSMSQPAAVAKAPPPQEAAEPAGPTQRQARASAPENQVAALYGEPKVVELEIPDAIKAERDADRTRSLYDPAKTFGDTLNERILFSDPVVAEQISPEMQRAVVKELAEMAVDVGMNNGDVHALQAVFRHANETTTEETRTQWREQAEQRLRETYGKDAEQAYRDAVKFVRADPRRVQMLEHNGAGDHPDAVLLFARLARQARMQGRLKQ